MRGFETQKQLFRVIHLAGFGVSRKHIENERQKGVQIITKLSFGCSWGQNFEFLEVLLRSLIYDEYLIGKKSTPNQKNRHGDEKKTIVQHGSAGRAGSS